MTARTMLALWQEGQIRLLAAAMRLFTPYYRVVWLAAAARHGVLRRLAAGPCSLDALAAELLHDPGHRDALEAWLGMGVRLRQLGGDTRAYRLRGFLARQLARPERDAFAALFEEVAGLHHRFILDTPARLRAGTWWTLADQDGPLIARSSRITEPIGREAVDAVIDPAVPQRLLEVGAGSGIYIRHAAERNPRLEALGLELQADVAAVANRNLVRWGLAARARVETCDVRRFTTTTPFDVVTLQNNIYYFPMPERVALLRHLRSLLRPGGTLLVTTACRDGSPAMRALDLWSAATTGCGRLPLPEELARQLAEAGFAAVTRRNLLPGDSYWRFVGVAPS